MRALYLLGANSTPAPIRQDIIQRAAGGEKISYEQVKDEIARAKAPPPGKVIGRDGKLYPARREAPEAEPPPQPEPEPDTPVVYEHKADRSLALQIIDIGCKVMTNSLQGSRDGLERLNRVRKEMRKHWDVQWF